MRQNSSILHQSILHRAMTEGKVRPKALLPVLLALEKQRVRGSVPELTGTWQLLWTSGIKTIQKPVEQLSDQPKPIFKNIQQIIDPDQQQLINQVNFSLLQISVQNSLTIPRRNRLNFITQKVQIKLGSLPSISFPIGKATGWLQITYLHPPFKIARGNRGGIALYYKLNSNSSL
ncbi:PAP/fibrillin family protein [Spirulina sp. CS-785/01]|uniref:PAP/fibrillin family protein n=1 Tax=Spirulina sp. CS-785/01 TaxID=3021716 RepID=UPI0023300B3B|nr:PAP/fibrillin family protein [Spirulina sp. CS-785/01]MDB9311609.1 PAP/fibrillin family protein [Spirulina sp. CS-785/01]